MFREVGVNYRAAGDALIAAAAYSEAGNISIQLGDYRGALDDARSAIALRKNANKTADIGDDYNTLGRANQYLGDYTAALENYRSALAADRAANNLENEIMRLSNIGNIHFFLGQYSVALQTYLQASQRIAQEKSPDVAKRERQLVNANIAALYQRIGLEQKALDIYWDPANKQEALAPRDFAQLLLNEGVLYRRLGDPIKALELYRQAKELFQRGHQVDGEIQTLRNIGIANALDLNNLAEALRVFSEALSLSRQSANKRGIVQAALYRGEVLRRLGNIALAKSDLNDALANAEGAGLVEEQWKALYAIGRCEQAAGNFAAALSDFQRSVTLIESIRSTLKMPSLKTDFLADKREVYDAILALKTKSDNTSASDILHVMERSRARTLLDRLAARMPVHEATLAEIQSKLPPDAVLIEYWAGPGDTVAVWATSQASGVVSCGETELIQKASGDLLTAIAGARDWRTLARELGARLLHGVPLRHHVIVAPDGPLSIPFDLLVQPDSGKPLIETSVVSFLPAASLLVDGKKPPSSRWIFPWNRQLIALGDPPVATADPLARGETWQPLKASADEIRGIAALLPGRADIHLGSDAKKSYLLHLSHPTPPLIHLSTHALVDGENPDRSRIPLASDDSQKPDYLFQEEIYDLNLGGTELVSVSACDTARGRMIRGEGVEAFSQAFLSAGASATVTSLWKVSDEPTAEFMKQFYFYLMRGYPKSDALRETKLQFLNSNTQLSEPRYWAAFVLHGDGWNPCRRGISWAQILYAVAGIVAVFALAVMLYRLRVLRLRS